MNTYFFVYYTKLICIIRDWPCNNVEHCKMGIVRDYSSKNWFVDFPFKEQDRKEAENQTCMQREKPSQI